MSYEIIEIKYGSKAYEDALALRYEVLRKPLGLNYEAKDLATEINDRHYVATLNGETLGTLILTKVSDVEIKMRQVAISPAHQGKGIGRLLVSSTERIAQDLGFQSMSLSARDSAIPFYISLNYQVVGHGYMSVGLLHHLMTKVLA